MRGIGPPFYSRVIPTYRVLSHSMIRTGSTALYSTFPGSRYLKMSMLLLPVLVSIHTYLKLASPKYFIVCSQNVCTPNVHWTGSNEYNLCTHVCTYGRHQNKLCVPFRTDEYETLQQTVPFSSFFCPFISFRFVPFLKNELC